MSKTYKTRPYWVKVNDSHRLVDEHDHRDGECDLPIIPVFWRAVDAPQTSCRWEESTDQRMNRANWCGCAMCTMQVERRADRRRSRREGRSYARGNWKNEY